MYEEKTGHMYYGTSMAIYESTDNCGTCDGVRCETCRTRYIVEDLGKEGFVYFGFDKEEAEKHIAELEGSKDE